eukprot:2601558-Amphidinium_carterae.1
MQGMNFPGKGGFVEENRHSSLILVSVGRCLVSPCCILSLHHDKAELMSDVDTLSAKIDKA